MSRQLTSEIFIVKSLHEAIQNFMDRNIIPFATKRNWNEFRDSVVHHAKVAEILVDHMNFLRRLYARYSNEV